VESPRKSEGMVTEIPTIGISATVIRTIAIMAIAILTTRVTIRVTEITTMGTTTIIGMVGTHIICLIIMWHLNVAIPSEDFAVSSIWIAKSKLLQFNSV